MSEYAETRLGETSASETVPCGTAEGWPVRGFVGLIQEIGQIELWGTLTVQVGCVSNMMDTYSFLFGNPSHRQRRG